MRTRDGATGPTAAILVVSILLGGVLVLPTSSYKEQPYVGDAGGRDTVLCFAELNGRLYPYRVYYPRGYKFSQKPKSPDFKLYPMAIFCHSSNADESAYFMWRGNSDRLQTAADQRGYVVVAPAAPGRYWHDRDWTEEKAEQGLVRYRDVCKQEGIDVLMEIVPEMVKQNWIDKDRVYLTGASSGAIVTYGTAAQHPEKFAAVCGVCGVFMDDMVEGLANVPVLMFNAAKDKLFPIDRVRSKMKKLVDAGGDVTMHLEPGGHGGYRDLDSYGVLFDFFDQHTNQSTAAAPDHGKTGPKAAFASFRSPKPSSPENATTEEQCTGCSSNTLSGLNTKLCFAEDDDGIVRPYRLFIPSSYKWAPSEPKGEVQKFPLVLMFHGGGSASCLSKSI